MKVKIKVTSWLTVNAIFTVNKLPNIHKPYYRLEEVIYFNNVRDPFIKITGSDPKKVLKDFNEACIIKFNEKYNDGMIRDRFFK